MKTVIAIFFLLLVLGVTACAISPPRYLSAAEDAAMREKCQPAGCVVVPLPIWEKVLQFLQSLNGV